MRKIHKHPKMSQRLEEENRLQHLEQITLKYLNHLIIINEQKNNIALGATYRQCAVQLLSVTLVIQSYDIFIIIISIAYQYII